MDDELGPEVSVIPAQPGWYVVEPLWETPGDSGTEYLDRLLLHPVIAWVVRVDKKQARFDGPWRVESDVEPLTVDGPAQDFILKTPDGAFHCPYDWFAGSEQKAKDLIVEDRQHQKEAEARRKAKAEEAKARPDPDDPGKK